MKLAETEKYIRKGIKLKKIISSEQTGLFSYKPATYDYKTVIDLEEAVGLMNNGWFVEDLQHLFNNLVLNIWRDLKAKK